MARIIVTLTAPLFYFFFFSLLSHQTMSQPQHIYTHCNSSNNFTQSSSYESHLDTLLTSLRKSSSLGTYSNATIGLSPDTVHGMFLCRGDINATSCAGCVQTAIFEITTNCSLNKAAVTYYQKCMVRYSDISFLTLMETKPGAILYPNNQFAPNLNRFNQTLTDKFDQLIINVSLSSSIPYFLEDQERVTQPEGSYELESMVQCSPDLDPLNCTVCLKSAFPSFFSTCCGLPSVFQVFTPKCLLRYETTVLQSPPLPSQSFSINVIKGNEIFGRIVATVTALLVSALVDL